MAVPSLEAITQQAETRGFWRHGVARPEQLAPEGDWDTWLLLAGRGFGKSRTGAEWVIEQALAMPGSRGALVAPTASDCRDIMVEGESGIMACALPGLARYEPSKRRVTFGNGSILTCYSADEPDRLRGPQHAFGWLDELASWRHLQHAWDMLQMGMRLGEHPRICITTTPRPLPLIKELLKDERTAVVRGSTYANLNNLAPSFRRAVISKYEGTTLGRQELDAEVLDDLPGALLSRSILDRNRVDTFPPLQLRLVAMDPAGTGRRDETGLIAGGRGTDGHDYLTHDWSAKLSSRDAAVRAWELVDEVEADFLVYEDNFGKGWVKEVLSKVYEERTGHPAASAPLREVHASHGKLLRAQPVVMRYEQGRVHHVGTLGPLEDQYTTWIPEEDPKSPDRVDAAVHLIAYCMKRFDRGQAESINPHTMRRKPQAEHPAVAARRAAAARKAS